MEEIIYKRDIFDEIVKYLNTRNIIVLQGARQVGKTYILYYLNNFLKSKGSVTYYFDLEDSRFVDLINGGVDNFISFLKTEGIDFQTIKRKSSKAYIFIDEIQYLDHPSSFLKLIVDHHPYIQLIVSGSSSFEIKSKFSDSLVGRTINFEIFNLSFFEFLRFKQIKLNLLQPLNQLHQKKVQTLYQEYILYGGYPKIVLEESQEKKEKYLQQIIDSYLKKDIRDLAAVKEINKFNNLLRLLASQSGQLVNVTELSRTCSLAKQTVERYLFILENTYVIKFINPFSSNIKSEVRKMPKIFFYDTGLLQMLIYRHLPQLVTGSILETSVFGELVKKYGRENIYFWRNKNQKEIDFILKTEKEILPIEVKTSFRQFRKKTMAAFCNRYKLKKFIVVGINGEKLSFYEKYPWEIYAF